MANANFDFKEFSAKKMNAYIKEYCKPAVVRKAKAGILMVDFKMAGKKMPCVFIPLKKKPEAMNLFKQIKKDKEHIIKKTALAEVIVKKGADGKEEITINIRKGGISAEQLKAKGAKLFESGIKMKLNVLGGSEAVAEKEATQDEAETSGKNSGAKAEGEAESNTEGKEGNKASDSKPKIMEALTKIFGNSEKVVGAIGKIDDSKIKANGEKLKAGFMKVVEQIKKMDEVDEEVKELATKVKSKLKEILTAGKAGSSKETKDSGKAIDAKKLKAFAGEGKGIIADFKDLKKTIDKNLEDLESDENDVKLVEDMIKRVETLEHQFDSFNEAEMEKVAKIRDAIKGKVAPALKNMMKDVVKYLKIRDKVVGNKAKNNKEAKSRISDLNARLAALEKSLAEN